MYTHPAMEVYGAYQKVSAGNQHHLFGTDEGHIRPKYTWSTLPFSLMQSPQRLLHHRYGKEQKNRLELTHAPWVSDIPASTFHTVLYYFSLPILFYWNVKAGSILWARENAARDVNHAMRSSSLFSAIHMLFPKSSHLQLQQNPDHDFQESHRRSVWLYIYPEFFLFLPISPRSSVDTHHPI